MPTPRLHLCLPLFLLLTACGTGISQSANSKTLKKIADTADPKLYRAHADDPDMNEAIARARFNLPRFDSALASNLYDKNWNMLKVRFPTPSGGGEHIWLAGITKVNGHYKGLVNDTVYETTQVKEGDWVIVNDADITDWMYGTDSVMHGAYTTRVIISRMTPKERAEYYLNVGYRIKD